MLSFYVIIYECCFSMHVVFRMQAEAVIAVRVGSPDDPGKVKDEEAFKSKPIKRLFFSLPVYFNKLCFLSEYSWPGCNGGSICCRRKLNQLSGVDSSNNSKRCLSRKDLELCSTIKYKRCFSNFIPLFLFFISYLHGLFL